MLWGWQGGTWWMAGDDTGDGGVLGLVVRAVAAIFRGSGWTWPRPNRPDPEQILAESFAAGEIDEVGIASYSESEAG